MKRLLRGNPDLLNEVSGVAFLAAVIISMSACIVFLFGFLAPYLISHVHVHWG